MNQSIRFASSRRDEHSAPAIKLLYKLVPREEADRMLESLTSDAQDISLPAEAIAEVKKALEQSNALLPEKERTFKGWNVGLLQKWQ